MKLLLILLPSMAVGGCNPLQYDCTGVGDKVQQQAMECLKVNPVTPQWACYDQARMNLCKPIIEGK